MRIKVAFIGYEIRRDLVEPLNKATRIKPFVFYKYANYKDFDPVQYTFIKKYNNVIHLFFLLMRYKPDLVIGHEPLFLRVLPLNLVTFLYSWLFRKKYAFAVLENVDPEQKNGKITSIILKFFCRLYVSKVSFIATINKEAGHLVSKYSNKKDLNFKENTLLGVWGVDLNEFSPEPRSIDPKLSGSAVLFVGRLIEGKGIRYLLEAIPLVREKVKDVNLYIIGNGQLKNDIVNFCNKNNWAHYLGSIENKLIPGYFRKAKVTCVPPIATKKWSEQGNLVNIQSLACGTPVVSTNSGAIPEWISNGEVGILVEEKNIKALADALIKLLTDDELNKMLGYNGRRLATEKYDANKNFDYFEHFVLNDIFSRERK